MPRFKKGSKEAKDYMAKLRGMQKKNRKVYKPKSAKVKPKRRSYLARKKKSRRRKFTLPIAPIAGLAVGLVDPIIAGTQGDFSGAFKTLSARYTGYNFDAKQFDINALKQGLIPLMAGFGVHILASKLGINRMLGQAKVPIIRI